MVKKSGKVGMQKNSFTSSEVTKTGGCKTKFHGGIRFKNSSWRLLKKHSANIF